MSFEKIIVRPTSSNFWWGVYGFSYLVGWEDLRLMTSEGEQICKICLNSKVYLRNGLIDLKKDPEESQFVEAIENYLADDKCHYWYYYNHTSDDNFYEVAYYAPTNERGEKPRFTDVWHPDESISISTIKSAVKDFIIKHFEIENCDVEIEDDADGIEKSYQSFVEYERMLSGDSQIKIEFSDYLVEELSNLWSIPKEEVLVKLNHIIK